MASLCLGAFFLTHSNGANGVEEEGAFTPLSGWRFLTRLDHWVEGYSNENPNSYYLEYSSACAQLLVQTLLCLLVLHVFKPRVACGSLVLLSSQKCEYIWVCGNSGRDLNLAGGCRSPVRRDAGHSTTRTLVIHCAIQYRSVSNPIAMIVAPDHSDKKESQLFRELDIPLRPLQLNQVCLLSSQRFRSAFKSELKNMRTLEQVTK